MSFPAYLLDPFTAPLVTLSNEPALFDRSVNQSIDQSTDEKGPMIGANQSISGREPPVVNGTVRLINQSISQSIIDAPTDENDDSSIDQSNQSINQSVNQSINHPFQETESRLQREKAAHQLYVDVVNRLTARELSQSLPFSQSIKQSITQSINQPIALHLPPHIRDVGDLAVWSLSSAKRGNGISALRDGSNESFWQSDGGQPHTVSLSFASKMRIQSISLYVDFKLDESYTPSRIAIKAGNNVDELVELGTIELEEVTGWITFQTRQLKERIPSIEIDENDDHDDQSINQSINQSVKKPTNEVKTTLSPPVFGPHSFFSPAITDQTLPSINQSKSSKKRKTADSDQYTYLRCHYLQISILASHQSGKDTHIRQVRVFGPAPAYGDLNTTTRSKTAVKSQIFGQPNWQTSEMLQTRTLR